MNHERDQNEERMEMRMWEGRRLEAWQYRGTRGGEFLTLKDRFGDLKFHTELVKISNPKKNRTVRGQISPTLN